MSLLRILHWLIFGLVRLPVLDSPEDARCPSRYADLSSQGFYVASRALRAHGYISAHEHNIKRIKIEWGERLIPGKGWAVRCGNVWAGAWKGSYTIGLAVAPLSGDPNLGAVNDLAHEWAHAFLDYANIERGNTEGQHKIMKDCGLL